MFWFIISRFLIVVNYHNVVVRYTIRRVATFNETWIGGKVLISYVVFPTRFNFHLIKAMLLCYVQKL